MIFLSPQIADNQNAAKTHGSQKPKRRFAFTIIELLVVIGIIGMLLAFFLPAVRTSGEAARRSHCKNNLRNIGLALHLYHEKYCAFPPPYTVDEDGKRLHSWRTLILPFLEQQALYDQIDLSKPWDDPVNAEAYASQIPAYDCPSDDIPITHTTYLAFVSADSFFRTEEPTILSGDSGQTSQTVMVVEVAPEHAVHWMDPRDAGASNVTGFGEETEFAHDEGAHAVFVDGSVTFVSWERMPAKDRGKMMSYDRSGE